MLLLFIGKEQGTQSLSGMPGSPSGPPQQEVSSPHSWSHVTLLGPGNKNSEEHLGLPLQQRNVHSSTFSWNTNSKITFPHGPNCFSFGKCNKYHCFQLLQKQLTLFLQINFLAHWNVAEIIANFAKTFQLTFEWLFQWNAYIYLKIPRNRIKWI